MCHAVNVLQAQPPALVRRCRRRRGGSCFVWRIKRGRRSWRSALGTKVRSGYGVSSPHSSRLAESQQFQPILDSFGRREISVKDLYDATEWSTRWVWPFELYAPVFEAARDNGSPLVALNPATEVRRKLPLEGLQALTAEDRGLYLPDALGFAATLRDPNFRSYAAHLYAEPSHQDL
eukprot:Skav218352  [mRNA]  locus=scaffold755:1253895:1262570:- [translate_table: standard]